MGDAGQKAVASVTKSMKSSSDWNTSYLGMRLAGDATAAAAAGGLVAPLISIIDRYVACTLWSFQEATKLT